MGRGMTVDDPLKPAPLNRDHIEKALELLARGHNFDTFDVSFRQRYLNFFDSFTRRRTRCLSAVGV